MSTKIYNGFLLPYTEDLLELYEIMGTFRKRALEVAHEAYLAQVAEDASRFHDRAKLDLLRKPLETSPLSRARDLILDMGIKGERGERVGRYDFECTALVFPLREEKKLLAMLFHERSEYREVFIEETNAKEFNYWDNVDPEDGISYESWDRRGVLWEKALGESQIPALEGIGFKVNKETHFWRYKLTSEDVVEKIPSLKDRVESVLKVKLDRIWSEERQKKGDDSHWSYMKYVDWKRKPESKALAEELREELRETLVDPLTKEDLWRHDLGPENEEN